VLSDWFRDDTEGLKRLSSYTKIDNWLKLLNPKTRWGYIILDNKTPMGFIDLERIGEKRGGFSFYTAPLFRGKGYCRKIIQTLITLALQKNLDILYCGVEKDNQVSIKCLISIGFKHFGIDKDNMLEYELKLTPVL